MTTGEIMGLATVIGSIFTMLGATNIDAGMISQAITSIISLVTLGAAVGTFVAHRRAVKANTASAQQ